MASCAADGASELAPALRSHALSVRTPHITAPTNAVLARFRGFDIFGNCLLAWRDAHLRHDCGIWDPSPDARLRKAVSGGRTQVCRPEIGHSRGLRRLTPQP